MVSDLTAEFLQVYPKEILYIALLTEKKSEPGIRQDKLKYEVIKKANIDQYKHDHHRKIFMILSVTKKVTKKYYAVTSF